MKNIYDFKNTMGLTIAGGGAKGAFAVGVIKYLWEQGITYYPTIIGTSTGALISSKIALASLTQDYKHIEDLIEIFSTVKWKDIYRPSRKYIYHFTGSSGVFLLQSIKNKNCIYTLEPLKNLLDNYLSKEDWEIISKGTEADRPVEVGFRITDFKAGDSRTVANSTHSDIQTLKDAMLASSSIPIFSPLVEVDDTIAADGGLVDVSPIEAIFELESCKKLGAIFNILLDPPQESYYKDSNFEGMFDTVLRTIEISLNQAMKYDYFVGHLLSFMSNIKHNLDNETWEKVENCIPEEIKDMFKLDNLNNYKQIFEIHPPEYLGRAFDFNQPQTKNWIEVGYELAKNNFSNS